MAHPVTTTINIRASTLVLTSPSTIPIIYYYYYFAPLPDRRRRRTLCELARTDGNPRRSSSGFMFYRPHPRSAVIFIVIVTRRDVHFNRCALVGPKTMRSDRAGVYAAAVELSGTNNAPGRGTGWKSRGRQVPPPPPTEGRLRCIRVARGQVRGVILFPRGTFESIYIQKSGGYFPVYNNISPAFPANKF